MTRRRKKKLLDRVRDAIRTEQAYVGWIRRFILFHDKRHPKEMGAAEIEEYLTYLAVDRNVAASTQNQALSALLFLYQNVLKKALEHPVDVVRAKKPKRLPTVLTREEAQPETRHPARLSSQLRHPPPRGWLRYPHRAGTPRPQERQDRH